MNFVRKTHILYERERRGERKGDRNGEKELESEEIVGGREKEGERG